MTSRGERLLVGLDEAADVGDHAAAGGRGHLRPLRLRGARGARGVDERGGVAERDLGDDRRRACAGLVEVRWPPGASVRASPPITEAIDGAPDAASARELSSVDMATTVAECGRSTC